MPRTPSLRYRADRDYYFCEINGQRTKLGSNKKLAETKLKGMLEENSLKNLKRKIEQNRREEDRQQEIKTGKRPFRKTIQETVELCADKLEEQGHVVFCTSPSADAKCPSEKVVWLRNQGFLGPMATNYQIGPMKELNAGSGAILIDDSDSNVQKFRDAGGTAVLFPQPWNENRDKRERLEYVLEEIKHC